MKAVYVKHGKLRTCLECGGGYRASEEKAIKREEDCHYPGCPAVWSDPRASWATEGDFPNPAPTSEGA